MAKKKTTPTSGVDLSTLNQDQLNLLSSEIKARREQLAKDKVASLSGEIASLAKEWKALVKEGKAINRTSSFEITLPVTFTLKTKLDPDELMSAVDGGWGVTSYGNIRALIDMNWFNFSLTADLAKDDKLTKLQYKVLSEAVKENVANACNEIYGIVPDELATHYFAFQKKIDVFAKKLEDLDLGFNDLGLGE